MQGSWEHAFNPAGTAPMPFLPSSGGEVSAAMMFRKFSSGQVCLELLTCPFRGRHLVWDLFLCGGNQLICALQCGNAAHDWRCVHNTHSRPAAWALINAQGFLAHATLTAAKPQYCAGKSHIPNSWATPARRGSTMGLVSHIRAANSAQSSCCLTWARTVAWRACWQALLASLIFCNVCAGRRQR
jgi:hypothetical protein